MNFFVVTGSRGHIGSQSMQNTGIQLPKARKPTPKQFGKVCIRNLHSLNHTLTAYYPTIAATGHK